MATPMRKQYNRLKKKYQDCILFFRLGDFYECFDNDAKVISKVLSIVLTNRGKGENRYPMAGIPYHALGNYLPKLIKAGYKAAIVEQLEAPQKNKKIVARDVVKIVSAGTITNDKLLDESRNNYIACVSSTSSKNRDTWAIAVCDLTTGEFRISEFSCQSEDIQKLIDELQRIRPVELLVSEHDSRRFEQDLENIRLQKVPKEEFNFVDSRKELLRQFNVKSLKGFGIEDYKTGITAAGILLHYLQKTQKTSLSHINKVSYKKISDYMLLDKDSIRNLELVTPIRQGQSPTLLNVLNKCLTPMGKRKLYNWVLNPLVKPAHIGSRLDAVEEIFRVPVEMKQIRSKLNEIFDIQRILGKIGTETVNARDFLALRNSLLVINAIPSKLSNFKSLFLKKVFTRLTHTDSSDQIIKLISETIVSEPPMTITEGGIIREGFDKKLDTLQSAAKGGKEWMRGFQEEEIRKTKIQSLKIKFNKVFGYYIEISKANLSKVPSYYTRKQTLVNAERFITPELKEKEELVLHAEEQATQLEYEIFVSIRQQIAEKIEDIQNLAETIAVLDCIVNFAYIARLYDYSKPKLIGNACPLPPSCREGRRGKKTLQITDGRHPVVEYLAKEEFIPNDLLLNCDSQQIAIITGPNMAGKSTYIRQSALIVLMAQIGSFVPAVSMEFSPVDRIFTRIGASDNLASGESTFLVEMNETANILNNATEKSLIILDEVGRGTSTYDGIAIAWAVVEFIHDKIKAKTLFATHYHELIDMDKYFSRVKNFNVAIKESSTKQKIIFLRKVQKGGTDKSYGVHVAEFAGIPAVIIQRAKKILLSLKQEAMFEVKHIESEITDQEPESSKQIPLGVALPDSPVIKELRDLNINSMTPIEALEKLNDLIEKAKIE